MSKLHVKMSTGEEFSISNEFYGGNRPMDRTAARVQGGFLLTKMVSVGTDQGPVIHVPQVVYYWVED